MTKKLSIKTKLEHEREDEEKSGEEKSDVEEKTDEKLDFTDNRLTIRITDDDFGFGFIGNRRTIYEELDFAD
ncbi:unnamed protein product [Rhizophagus irregularis]|uniref:Uncharacterized protein n=1 Tax=Rhizophagus irregularis TaxID=588596 RepID=A0A915Z2F4_9GLOM|nr:unnamed protein product [Rhizophagus irregularis]CAB5359871.1 unnamed protein product [Rhizophagus irregularis]